jgi:hypothetical protein
MGPQAGLGVLDPGHRARCGGLLRWVCPVLGCMHCKLRYVGQVSSVLLQPTQLLGAE